VSENPSRAAQSSAAALLHPDTALGPVTIRVADIDRSVRFYQEILGFQPAAGENGLVSLGAGGPPVVVLRHVAGARPNRRASGLYHFAILVPSRAALGQALRRLAEAEIGIGEADHRVSEALYLSDPDGNGIEIYSDRPRSQWRWSNGTVQMATEPLDLEGLLKEGGREASPPRLFPDGTRIGHVHLQVADVEKAVDFYRGVVGFDLTAAWQGAAFLSAGGYHHHLGLNSWASRGAPAAPEGATGLESFVIRVPDAEAQSAVARRFTAAGVAARFEDGILRARDPWNIEVRVAL
jgi:catechol 2,3-dioxygenase